MRLGNRAIEAEFALRVIFGLQRLETILAPLVGTVPFRSGLVTERIVEVDVNLLTTTTPVDDLAQLVAKVSSLLVQGGAVGGVGDERGEEKVVLAEGKGSGVTVDSLDTLVRVTLEHEEGVVEGRIALDVSREQVVGLALSGDVVGLDVDGEPGVVEAGLLARDGIKVDSGPGSEVEVGSGGGRGRDRADVEEGLGVGGVDDIDTLLDDPEQDDGLSDQSVCVIHVREMDVTHVLSIGVGVVQPVGPVDNISRLGSVLQQVVIGGLIDLLNLVSTEYESINGPVAVFDVIDLDVD